MPAWAHAEAVNAPDPRRAAATMHPNQPRTNVLLLGDAVAFAVSEHLRVPRTQRTALLLFEIVEQIRKPRNRTNVQVELAFDELHAAVAGIAAVFRRLFLAVQRNCHAD